MKTTTEKPTIQCDGTYTYRGLTLYERADDGTYWVSGWERWMTLEQIDQRLDEQAAE